MTTMLPPDTSMLLFPADRTSFMYGEMGDPIRTPFTTALVIYLDEQATAPAQIRLPDSGAVIANSTIYTDQAGMLPEFLAPPGYTRLWAVAIVDGKPATPYPLDAAFGPRIDLLEQSGGGGGAGRFFDYTYEPPMDGVGALLAGETMMADGVLHFDTEDQPAAGTIYISPITDSGVDVSARIVELPVGASLWVQDRNDSTMHSTYLLAGQATYDDAMGAWQAPVTYDEAHSAAPLVSGQSILAGVLDTAVPGPQGPPGPPGPPGPGTGSGGAFTHMQYVSANIWDIRHTLGFVPSVTVVDSAGSLVVGDVSVLAVDHLQVFFSAPFSGSAYLS